MHTMSPQSSSSSVRKRQTVKLPTFVMTGATLLASLAGCGDAPSKDHTSGTDTDVTSTPETPFSVLSCFVAGDDDLDLDGLTNTREREIGTDPCKKDSDGDGFDDKVEVVDNAFDPEVDPFRYNPLVADLPSITLTVQGLPEIELQGTLEGSDTSSWGISREVSNSIGVSSNVSNTNTRSYERSVAVATSTEFGGSRESSSSSTQGVDVDVSLTVGAEVGVEAGLTGGVSASASVSATVGSGFSASTTSTSSQSTSFATSRGTTQQSTLSNEASVSWESGRSSEWTQASTAALESSSSSGFTWEGGTIRVGVKLENTGHLGMQIESVTLNAYDITDHGSRVPVATFRQESLGQLIEGASAPLIFENDELTLNTTRRLLRDPFGLAFELGGIDLRTDDGVGFSQRFSTVISNTATVAVDFDFPDAPPPLRFQVATEIPDENGEYTGLAIGTLFRDVLGMEVVTADEEVTNPFTGESLGVAKRLVSIDGIGTDGGPNRHWAIGIGSEAYTPDWSFEDFRLKKGDSIHLVLVEDIDQDGAGYLDERRWGTDPRDADEDDDGLSDGAEILSTWKVWDGADYVIVSSSPREADADGDGLDDKEERHRGTDPWSPDSDHDGAWDADDWGGFTKVVAGDGLSCGLGMSGDIRCWGLDLEVTQIPFKDFALGETEEYPPVTAPGCGIDAIGKPHCWGAADHSDQLPGPFATITVGRAHVCGLDPAGRVACWGDDTSDQVSGAPTGSFVSLDTSGDTTCALTATGTVRCWGGDDVAARTPVPATGWESVSVGPTATCAVDFAGDFDCFGEQALVDAMGRLKDRFPGETVTSVAVGGLDDAGVACATLDPIASGAGGYRCWGPASVFVTSLTTYRAGDTINMGGVEGPEWIWAAPQTVYQSVSVGLTHVCVQGNVSETGGRANCYTDRSVFWVTNGLRFAPLQDDTPGQSEWDQVRSHVNSVANSWYWHQGDYVSGAAIIDMVEYDHPGVGPDGGLFRLADVGDGSVMLGSESYGHGGLILEDRGYFVEAVSLTRRDLPSTHWRVVHHRYANVLDEVSFVNVETGNTITAPDNYVGRIFMGTFNETDVRQRFILTDWDVVPDAP